MDGPLYSFCCRFSSGIVQFFQILDTLTHVFSFFTSTYQLAKFDQILNPIPLFIGGVIYQQCSCITLKKGPFNL